LAFLAGLPYVASAVVYHLHYRRFFGRPHDDEPEGWRLDLVTPLLIACLTPLALAASRQEDDKAQVGLFLTTGLAVFVVFLMLTLIMSRAFYSMLQHVGAGRWELDDLTWSRLALLLGLAVILACAGVSVGAAAID
jgi:hypothetical protein